MTNFVCAKDDCEAHPEKAVVIVTKKRKSVDMPSLEKDISAALKGENFNACPFAVRLAWHSSGTYDKADGTGGSNGATMRFEPESADGANAGLEKARALLEQVSKKHPDLSIADLWIKAGCMAIELCGGPSIEFSSVRTDDKDGSECKTNVLPDASKGAQHLRDVFYRMGFDDKEIVCLSGAHTLGSCHTDRSGFDGPWTENPTEFDNSYFKGLVEKEWVQREWDGPVQYTDAATKTLMMLPTDIALIKDPEFKPHVEFYAANSEAFFSDFAKAFAKLTTLGCPFAANSHKRTKQDQ